MGKKTRAALIGGALAGAVVLGGCAQSPSNAATVNGTTITTSDLDSAYHGAQRVSDQITKQQTASVLIQGTVASQIAHRQHIKLTDTLREKQLNPKLLEKTDTRHFGYHLADVQIVAKKIGNKKLAKKIADANVEVNPRYGSWNPKKSVNVLPSSGSLSQASHPSDQPGQPGQPGR
jgi:parvulin-like peptidyl-prolyl isomerase